MNLYDYRELRMTLYETKDSWMMGNPGVSQNLFSNFSHYFVRANIIVPFKWSLLKLFTLQVTSTLQVSVGLNITWTNRSELKYFIAIFFKCSTSSRHSKIKSQGNISRFICSILRVTALLFKLIRSEVELSYRCITS